MKSVTPLFCTLLSLDGMAWGLHSKGFSGTFVIVIIMGPAATAFTRIAKSPWILSCSQLLLLDIRFRVCLENRLKATLYVRNWTTPNGQHRQGITACQPPFPLPQRLGDVVKAAFKT
jgi:hypothetical protein